jgi:hypothetical protein
MTQSSGATRREIADPYLHVVLKTKSENDAGCAKGSRECAPADERNDARAVMTGFAMRLEG